MAFIKGSKVTFWTNCAFPLREYQISNLFLKIQISNLTLSLHITKVFLIHWKELNSLQQLKTLWKKHRPEVFWEVNMKIFTKFLGKHPSQCASFVILLAVSLLFYKYYTPSRMFSWGFSEMSEAVVTHRCSVKRVFLNISKKWQENTSLSLDKVVGLRFAIFLEKRFRHRCAHGNVVKFLRTAFLIEHLQIWSHLLKKSLMEISWAVMVC